MAAGRGGLVATARNDLVNFGFQEAWKKSPRFFQGSETFPRDFPILGKTAVSISNAWKSCRARL
jgi:hypothetical protein